MFRLNCAPFLLVLALAGCLRPETPPSPEQIDLKTQIKTKAPAGDDKTCWAREREPAVFESVVEQAKVGVSHYASRAEQRIVSAPREIWFTTPCKAQMTPELIASLQRALMARGLYRGEINGVMTATTATALRDYQGAAGLQSPQLSLAAAQHLGLIVTR